MRVGNCLLSDPLKKNWTVDEGSCFKLTRGLDSHRKGPRGKARTFYDWTLDRIIGVSGFIFINQDGGIQTMKVGLTTCSWILLRLQEAQVE